MIRRFDYLVVGSGIAGLFYALEISRSHPGCKVAIVTKKGERDTNTNYAQGGIASVLSGVDSFDSHVADTLTAGAGLCDEKVVRNIVELGPRTIEELIAYGVQFSATEGHFDLGREGGHSANRVVHAADFTGREIERALLAACHARVNQITIFPDHIAIDLISLEENECRRCVGAQILVAATSAVESFLAPITLLATGGLGQIYYHSTNPRIATGDGVAIAWRGGVDVGNLEFIQFHPTVLYSPGRWPFLISEAVRGEGGRLRSVDGRYFLDGQHPLRELAPRDIVARAIDKELKESGEDFVYLDMSHHDSDFIQKRFPTIYATCLARGFDITKRPVPVVPGAHYACGGVVATVTGETKLAGLFVAGEVAMTGMHGANRLASNSLLEAVVMARNAVDASVRALKDGRIPSEVPDIEPLTPPQSREREKIFVAHERIELTRIMADFVGIVRTTERLRRAHERVTLMKDEIERRYHAYAPSYDLIELRNMVCVAELVICSALSRKESRGLHYNEDYPDTDESQRRNTIISGAKQTESYVARR
jgi:L-aspartate oxidase